MGDLKQALTVAEKLRIWGWMDQGLDTTAMRVRLNSVRKGKREALHNSDVDRWIYFLKGRKS